MRLGLLVDNLSGRLLAVSGLWGFFFFSLGRSGSEAPALLGVSRRQFSVQLGEGAMGCEQPLGRCTLERKNGMGNGGKGSYLFSLTPEQW